MKHVMIGTFLGVIPGAIMVLLTIPLSGEIELTVGVIGLALVVIGGVIGGIWGAKKEKRGDKI